MSCQMELRRLSQLSEAIEALTFLLQVEVNGKDAKEAK